MKCIGYLISVYKGTFFPLTPSSNMALQALLQSPQIILEPQGSPGCPSKEPPSGLHLRPAYPTWVTSSSMDIVIGKLCENLDFQDPPISELHNQELHLT